MKERKKTVFEISVCKSPSVSPHSPITTCTVAGAVRCCPHSTSVSSQHCDQHSLPVCTVSHDIHSFVPASCNSRLNAVPWPRRSVAGLSMKRTWFDPKSVYVRSVVEKVALGQICFRVKVKVKVTLQKATKAQRGSRGIALLFLKPRR